MDSLETSALALDVRQLRRQLRDLREAIGVLAEWTDGLVEIGYDTVHISLNNVAFATDIPELRAHEEMLKQIQALPGSAPTVPLSALYH